jgi:hypothetical protein
MDKQDIGSLKLTNLDGFPGYHFISHDHYRSPFQWLVVPVSQGLVNVLLLLTILRSKMKPGYRGMSDFDVGFHTDLLTAIVLQGLGIES